MEKTHGNMVISTGTMVRFILVLALTFFVYKVWDLVLVILTSIVIASAIEPGTKWFMDRRIPRLLAVILIYIAVTLIFAALFYFLLIPLLSDFSTFLLNLPEYSDELSTVQPNGLPVGIFGLGDLTLAGMINNLNTVLANVSSGFFGTIDAAFGGILSFLLIFVLSFYLAVQEDGVSKFLRVAVPLKHEEYIIDLWKRSQKKIGLWMQGQLMLIVIIGVLVFLGLSLLQVKHALLLAVAAAVFELIPVFGAFLAAAPAILTAVMDNGITMGFIVAGLFLIIQQFESQLIYPVVVKKVVGVPPIISILALVIGAKIAGFLGIILSVPLAAVFMEYLGDIEKQKGGARESALAKK